MNDDRQIIDLLLPGLVAVVGKMPYAVPGLNPRFELDMFVDDRGLCIVAEEPGIEGHRESRYIATREDIESGAYKALFMTGTIDFAMECAKRWTDAESDEEEAA